MSLKLCVFRLIFFENFINEYCIDIISTLLSPLTNSSMSQRAALSQIYDFFFIIVTYIYMSTAKWTQYIIYHIIYIIYAYITYITCYLCTCIQISQDSIPRCWWKFGFGIQVKGKLIWMKSKRTSQIYNDKKIYPQSLSAQHSSLNCYKFCARTQIYYH